MKKYSCKCGKTYLFSSEDNGPPICMACKECKTTLGEKNFGPLYKVAMQHKFRSKDTNVEHCIYCFRSKESIQKDI